MKRILLLILVTGCLAQKLQQVPQILKPTELEQAKLGKLKAENTNFQTQLQQIDTQIQALTILKQLTTEHQQQKYSEYLGEANKVKESHKEWGESNTVTFNPQQGEYGTFVKESK